MKKIWVIIFILFLVKNAAVFAQQENVEQFIENASEFSDDHELTELLNELELHPLNINDATAEELKVLPWISDVLAQRIIDYRKEHGEIKNLSELEQLPGFDVVLVSMLCIYLTTEKPPAPSLEANLRTRVFRKLQKSQGFKDGAYYPSREKIYNRFTFNYGEKISFGFLFEKDPGEKNLNDFQSYFFEFSPRKNWKIVAGNYLLEFAQGLVFWNPYARYKSANPIYSAKKRGRGVKKYTMVDENASLQGLASWFCSKFYQIGFFLSSKKLDATFDRNTDKITNFYVSGYHRTETEKAKKDRVQEQLYGSRLQIMPSENFSFGLTGYISQFNQQFTVTDRERYRFGFSEKENHVFGADFNLLFGDWNFFAETARSANSGFAAVGGIVFDTRNVDLAVLYRNYSPDFHSFHGSGFGEQGDVLQNERGLYFGVRFKPLKNMTISFYQDQFIFPWRTYTLPEPSSGNDYMAVLEYRPWRRSKIYFQIKHKESPRLKTVQAEDLREVDWVVPRKQTNLRCQFEHNPVKDLTLRFRWEENWVRYPHYSTIALADPIQFKGTLLYQEANYRLSDKLKISMRLTFFDTDGYESRLYQFERDIPGVLTNQMLYGKGSRWYLLCNYKLAPILSVSLKFSTTHYYYRSFIGSQADRINGDELSALALQLQSQW